MSTGHNADSSDQGSTRAGDVPVDRTGHRAAGLSKDDVYAREHEEYGGMKFGAAFFGWLTSVGAIVLLLAVVAVIASLVGVSLGADEATSALTQNLQTAGLWGAVIALVIWFVAYFCGGYVAGRMARFDGVKQGVAVWLWALIIGIVLGIIVAIAGANILGGAGDIISLPVDPSQLTVGGIISLLLLLAVSLGGAILGGISGMRYHRKVDDTVYGQGAVD